MLLQHVRQAHQHRRPVSPDVVGEHRRHEHQRQYAAHEHAGPDQPTQLLQGGELHEGECQESRGRGGHAQEHARGGAAQPGDGLDGAPAR
jgi:hypothetical protein